MTKPLAKLLASAVLLAIVVSSTATAALAGGTLRIAREQDSTSLDPVFTIQNADIWVINNMNSYLVRANPEATGVEPDLAESWDISEDGLTYTFHLREGLRFSDGSPLKASDVKFSLERLRDAEGSIMGSLFAIMGEIETPDDRTVVITLKQQSAPAMAGFAMFSAAIVPEAAVTAAGDEFGNNPVGAGAFMFDEWRRGEYLRLVKNPHYWEADRVQLDAIEWVYIPVDNARILKLQAGEVDAMIFVPFSRVAELDADPSINVHLDPSSRTDHMLINHASPPLDDLRVRQALYYAIDRQSIVDAVTFGHGKVANSYISEGALYYNPDNDDYPVDPDKARSLLAEAGQEDLSLDLLIAAGDSIHDQIGVIVKDQLGKVGIDLNLVKQEPGQQWDSMQTGDYDITIAYWTNDMFDPDQKSTYCLYGADENLSYFTRYKNPEVMELVEQGRIEPDLEKRRQIYYDLQRIAKDTVNWVDLYYSPFRNASRSNVKNFFQSPMGRLMLEDTSIQ